MSSAIEYAKKARKRAAKARRFPVNTCPASRHLHIMADCLMRPRKDSGLRYWMVQEEPEHVAGSIYDVITALWDARTELASLKARKPVRRVRKATTK